MTKLKRLVVIKIILTGLRKWCNIKMRRPLESLNTLNISDVYNYYLVLSIELIIWQRAIHCFSIVRVHKIRYVMVWYRVVSRLLFFSFWRKQFRAEVSGNCSASPDWVLENKNNVNQFIPENSFKIKIT